MMETTERLVRRFYYEVWNNADEAAAHEILDRNLRFRGSLGLEKSGPNGFIAYMRSIHEALGDYECIIDDLVVADARATARMTFKGVHQGTFLGFNGTGREIQWAGAAFFTIVKRRISDIWVLGDVDHIKRQLEYMAIKAP